MIRYSARRAERLTAISDYTRQDAIRRLNVNPEKITAIPLAADPIYNVGAPDEAVTNFREQRGLARNFFLYAGNISPRKNLKTLLAAFAMAKDGLDADLVITGGRAWDEDFDRLLRENGLTKRVIRLGHIEKKDMPLLYRSSLALVFPSLFEGFGLPVLEAQACGTPVICANATSLPEAAGDGALLIDPKSPESIRNALLSLAKDPELRSRLIEKGRVNEARFSWKSTARRTLAVFESLN
jgi:glycosyltransferase involved in cell wall biosynthesis